jgi:hypothetical protein
MDIVDEEEKMSQEMKLHSRIFVRQNTLLFVFVILLVIASSIGIFFFASADHMVAEGIRATATVQLNAMATADMSTTVARVNATGTAQVNATSTAQSQRAATDAANATATVTASLDTPYNLRGKSLAVNDSMSVNTSSTWSSFSVSNRSCTFSGDVYHVSITTQGNLQFCLAYNTDFSNFIYQVQLKLVKGNQGGIIFRSDSNGDVFYYFQINVNGSYTWGMTSSTGYTALSTKTSPAIKAGLDQTNLVAVVAQGKNFDFYINKQKVATFSDATHTHGLIGLSVEDDNNATEAVFSNVQLWTL